MTTVRRSLLYVPGDRPQMLMRAAQRGADCLILNLEDAVAPDRKAAARDAVIEALTGDSLSPCERIVRINPLETALGFRDLLMIVPASPDAILLPKVRDVEEVRFADRTIGLLEETHGLPQGRIGLMCMIESAAGLVEAPRIAACSTRLRVLVFGAADFAEDIGLPNAAGRDFLLPVMSQLVVAAKASGLSAIDAPHMRPDDPDGLITQCRQARSLGFDGKSAIHPCQIVAINGTFSPQPAEIQWAHEVLKALAPMDDDGSAMAGAALMDGELIEAPHVRRARQILRLAARINAVRDTTK
jgi:citrate lyase subunit beta/citryl-CoA lyase